MQTATLELEIKLPSLKLVCLQLSICHQHSLDCCNIRNNSTSALLSPNKQSADCI